MIKFLVVIGQKTELPATAEILPRVGEDIMMTVVGTRGRLTVYQITHDLDKQHPEMDYSAIKVYVR